MSGKYKNWPLEPFNDAVDEQDLRREWEEWLQSFELMLEMKQVWDQHEKYVVLLTMGGRGLQRIYYNLAPASNEIHPPLVEVPFAPFEEPEYDNAIKRLHKFFVGKQNERIELELFRSLRQSNDESFNKYLLRLRTQAARCDFKERTETEILHQITMAAKDERVRDKGLENLITLDELTNYALNRETLMKQKMKTRPFGEEVRPQDVAMVQHTPEQRTSRHGRGGYKSNRVPRQKPFNRYQPYKREIPTLECGRCGSGQHQSGAEQCPAFDARCNKCGQIGHFARKCLGGRSFTPRQHQRGGARSGEANNIRDEREWNVNVPRRPRSDDVMKVDYSN